MKINLHFWRFGLTALACALIALPALAQAPVVGKVEGKFVSPWLEKSSDGTSGELKLHLYPQAYMDGGKYARIDTEVKSGGNSGHAFVNDTNILKSGFAASAAEVSVEGDEGTMTYRPVSMSAVVGGNLQEVAQASGAAPTAQGSLVTYAGVFPGVDAIYEVRPGSVQQRFVFSRLPAMPAGASALAISESVQLPAGSSLVGTDGKPATGIVAGSLMLKIGKETLILAQPFAYDSAAAAAGLEQTPEPVMGQFRVEGTDGSITLTAEISWEWMSAPERVLPITIDPDVVLQPMGAAGKDAQLFSGSPNNNYGTRVYLTDNWGGSDADGIIEFDVSSIPAGSTINSATLEVWHGSNNEPLNFGAYLNGTSWDENTVTWNNAPALGTLTDQTPPQGGNTWHIWDVTVDVQAFVDGDPNHGWRLSAIGGSNTAYLHSSDNGDANDPILRINYDEGAPPGAPGAGLLSIVITALLLITGSALLIRRG